MGVLILQFSALLLIVVSILSLTNFKIWWVRATDFPRLQLACLALAWLVIATVFSYFGDIHWAWFLAVLVVFANQIWWIWPATSLHGKEVLDAASESSHACFSLLSSNVLMDNRQSARLIALVQDYKPDILATLESDLWWQTELDTLEQYPYRVACPLDNKYGMHVYSRLPLEESTVDFLVSDDIPSIGLRVRVGDSLIRVHIVHPTPPAPGENLSSEDRDVELLVLAESLKNVDEPVIVSGDLNDVAWSKTTRLFRSVSGLLDPRTGRGLFNTFHADYWFFRWPLDHVFVSNHWRLKKIERLRHIGSDHFPVYIELALSNPVELETHLTDPDEELRKTTLETDTAKEATKPSL